MVMVMTILMMVMCGENDDDYNDTTATTITKILLPN